MAQLTEKQQKVLDFIREFLAANRIPPTNRDICERFGVTTNSVVGYLTGLKAKGLVDWTPHKARSIRLTEKRKCPHCGGEI
jgi:repressor LexA